MSTFETLYIEHYLVVSVLLAHFLFFWFCMFTRRFLFAFISIAMLGSGLALYDITTYMLEGYLGESLSSFASNCTFAISYWTCFFSGYAFYQSLVATTDHDNQEPDK